MNIKKMFIAGISGLTAALLMGAMSVPAAAQNEIKLVYDLKTYQSVAEDSEVTITSHYNEASTSTAYTFDFEDNLAFEANQMYLKDMPIVSATVEITGKNVDGKEISHKATYSKRNIFSDIYVDKYGKLSDGTAVFADTDKDGYEEFILPISRGIEQNKINVNPYTLTTLGYSSEKEFGFSEITVHTTYKIPAEIKVKYRDVWGDAFYEFVGVDPYTLTKPSVSAINSDLVCGNKAFNLKPSSYYISDIEAGVVGDAVYPFKTTLSPVGAENNVVAALQARKANGNYYTRPIAVINDAIANHEDVVFTFKSFDGYVATKKSEIFNESIKAGRAYNYSVTPYDWYNPTFDQHLYITDDVITYGSYSSAWGVNLFAGGIVVNGDYTMQLNDVDYFTWQNDTLTFNWSDITAQGKITDAKEFLLSMSLYTPIDWYWDTLTVEVVENESEDISAGAGLSDDATYEEIIEPIDETVEEVTTATEETITATVETEEEAEYETVVNEVESSPETGNKSIIPVCIMALLAVALAAMTEC